MVPVERLQSLWVRLSVEGGGQSGRGESELGSDTLEPVSSWAGASAALVQFPRTAAACSMLTETTESTRCWRCRSEAATLDGPTSQG